MPALAHAADIQRKMTNAAQAAVSHWELIDMRAVARLHDVWAPRDPGPMWRLCKL